MVGVISNRAEYRMDRSPAEPESCRLPPPSRRGLRRLWNVVRLLAIVYLGIVLAMMFLEESLIFIPLNYAEDDWHPRGLTIEEANFQAADGVALHGWYIPHPKPKAAVLFLHGNAGNITHRVGILQALHTRARVSVLIFDYRGYGHSKGKPSERGILADARAARDWLARREKIRPADVVLMGESLGGGVAVDLAATDGAGRWCWKAPSRRSPTWRPIIIRGCRSAC